MINSTEYRNSSSYWNQNENVSRCSIDTSSTGNSSTSEWVNNLRTQLVLFQIKNFTHKHELLTNKNIKYNWYKNIRTLKSVCVLIYTFMAFFEKPFYCFKSLSIPFINQIECEDNIASMGLPVIPPKIFFVIELFWWIAFVGIQLLFANERRILGHYSRSYKILQIVLFSFIGLCILELVVIVWLNDIYPIINFLLRGFIVILLVRNWRWAWVNIISLLWKTKTVFCLLFCNIFVFAFIGFFLFSKKEQQSDAPYSKDFQNIYISMYSWYILLSTCNFPDVMLSTFPISKLSVFFFIIYITINLFIILSLLKALYYSNYFDIYKAQGKELINMIKNKSMQDNAQIYNKSNFHTFLIQLNKKFSLTKDEYDKILQVVGLNNETIFTEELKVYQEKEDLLHMNKFFRFFNQRRVEVVINIIDLLLIFLLLTKAFNNNIIIQIQIIWCSCFICEALLYIYYLGLKRMLLTELIKSAFFCVNFLLFVCLISLEIYKIMGWEVEFSILFEWSKPWIVWRAIRIFVLLKWFKEFQIIFSTLHNMKSVFSGHFLNLFSLFYLFSTFSMLLIGGTIRIDSFVDKKEIPNNYYHINFNDFGSSYLSCFALMMINNVNIIAKSLSIAASESTQTLYNSYFATFYFLSTLIILNICQTLLLEMYLTIKAKKL